ncbi:hypothetical protein [Bailinhaonella thermotolerans]|uniref:Uncharacterized protein n=1 Tax=Bailinhaonella thermotolerans TaxID=1070861 RepID=A0A3A4AYU1_9ACTN|nr:hypothetical protein [Bailinhaonella thermotolerans]RJL32676.1 hypothetical protein D5H75_14370 [Bailinhaonella thermotolerans]
MGTARGPLATAAAQAGKLTIASLAFAGAYLGFQDVRGAETTQHLTLSSPAPESAPAFRAPASGTAASGTTASGAATSGSVTARSERSVPAVPAARGFAEQAAESAPGPCPLVKGRCVTWATAPRTEAEPACASSRRVRSLITAPAPVTDVRYGWRLLRRNSVTGEWETYTASGGRGFRLPEGVRAMPVRWDAPTGANPGWYRVDIEIAAPAEAVARTGHKFLVTC